MEHDDTQEDADFAAGFAETAAAPAEQPAAATSEASTENEGQANAAPAPAAAAPAAPASAPANATTDDHNQAPPPDPFAGLPKEVRDLLAEIPTMRAELAHAKSLVGQVPYLRSKLEKMTTPATAAPAPEPRQSPTKIQSLRAQGLDEIADAIEEATAVGKTADAPAPAPSHAAAPAAPAQDEPPEFKTLSKLRPNWLDTVNSSDYVLWLNRQPPAYRQQVESSSDPADILLSLNDFDRSLGTSHNPPPPPPQPSNTRSARMAAAVVPQGDGKRAARGPQPLDEDEAFLAGFNGG